MTQKKQKMDLNWIYGPSTAKNRKYIDDKAKEEKVRISRYIWKGAELSEVSAHSSQDIEGTNVIVEVILPEILPEEEEASLLAHLWNSGLMMPGITIYINALYSAIRDDIYDTVVCTLTPLDG